MIFLIDHKIFRFFTNLSRFLFFSSIILHPNMSLLYNKWMSLNYTKHDMQICESFSHASYISVSGGAFPPEFAAPISNLTVALGRDATFTCLVKHLGGYRVSFFLWKFINRWCMKFLQRWQNMCSRHFYSLLFSIFLFQFNTHVSIIVKRLRTFIIVIKKYLHIRLFFNRVAFYHIYYYRTSIFYWNIIVIINIFN